MQQQDLKAIGSRVKTIRKTTKVLQSDIAKESRLSVKTISVVENGHASPPQELLDVLSTKYGYNIDWILTGHGSENRGKNNDKSNTNIQAKVHKIEVELNELKKLVKDLTSKIDRIYH
jgi:transcriptional regulator with XRE-family HTH domain